MIHWLQNKSVACVSDWLTGKLLLVHAWTVFLGSGFQGMHDHILLFNSVRGLQIPACKVLSGCADPNKMLNMSWLPSKLCTEVKVKTE
jgi:hypothetical protein